MTKLSEAEQNNYIWLMSVVSRNSPHTTNFKQAARNTINKFERKMKK